MRRKTWLYLSLGCLGISVVSLFLSVISYTDSHGVRHAFNILNLILHPEAFYNNVSSEYTGELFRSVSAQAGIIVIAAVAVVALLALACAITGMLLMNRQRPTSGSFVLALIGLIGTALPAIVILVLLMMSGRFFLGSLRAGLYAMVTPMAMVLSIITVSMKHNRTKAQLRAWQKARGYLRLGGDL